MKWTPERLMGSASLLVTFRILPLRGCYAANGPGLVLDATVIFSSRVWSRFRKKLTAVGLTGEDKTGGRLVDCTLKGNS